MKKVLICVHFNSYFSNLFDIAKLLKLNGYEPEMMFVTDYPKILRDIELCKHENIPTFDKNNSPVTHVANISQQGSTRLQANFFPDSLKLTLNEIRRFWKTYKAAKKRISYLKELFKTKKYRLLILGGDIAGTDTSIVIKAGNDLGIPSLACVNWLGKYEAASIYRENPFHRTGSYLNKLAASLYPCWVLKSDQTEILKHPGPELIAFELLGLAPSNPWVLHSGPLTALAVEGEVMKFAAIKMGLKAKSIFITGTIKHDLMKNLLKNEKKEKETLLGSLGLKGNKVILTALPPDFLYTVNGRPQCPNCEFNDYETMIKFWLSTLNNTPFPVVVSLHPSVNPDDYLWIQNDKVKISTHPISELIPLCDIFVASISATINWAIACGKPVINYDVYKYRYDDYATAPGVLTFEESLKFSSISKKLTEDEAYLHEVSELQKVTASRWAQLDGNSGARILDLVSQLTSNIP